MNMKDQPEIEVLDSPNIIPKRMIPKRAKNITKNMIENLTS